MTDLTSEWLETDGLGGFASGTVGGFRTRRYHALLLMARKPPTDRIVLVNGFEAAIELGQQRYALSTQLYEPNVYYPDGQRRLKSFTREPWPTWTWQLDPETTVELELFVPHERSMTVLAWRVSGGLVPFRLSVLPLISGRDYHSLHHENPTFQFATAVNGSAVTIQPYADLPSIRFVNNGRFNPDAMWFRNFLYSIEEERGLDCVEDLAAPGSFSWDLEPNQRAVWILAADGPAGPIPTDLETVEATYQGLR